MNIKFIHTADLHLDTPFKGLGEWNPWLAGKLKDATYRSFSRIIDLAISEKVDFVLIAGDIFDSENMSLAAQMRFTAEMKRLTESGIKAYLICGNHDHLGSWDKGFPMPPGIFRFGSSGVGKTTFSKNGKPVADIYGISYQTSYVEENLSLSYNISGSPAPFSIAMLHGMADIVGKDERYAPFGLRNLLEKSFDYWALGHVHARRILNDDPPVLYPGNPQGRDFGETGSKGCYLVEMKTGHKPALSFIPVQDVRLEEIRIDLTGQENISSIGDLIEEAKDKVVSSDRTTGFVFRVLLTGRTGLHKILNRPGEAHQLTEELNSHSSGGNKVSWIDSIEVMTRPPVDIERLREGGDFLAVLIRNIERYENDTELLSEIIDQLGNELPAARIFRETGQLSEDNKKEILEKAKWMLVDKLVNEPDNFQ